MHLSICSLYLYITRSLASNRTWSIPNTYTHTFTTESTTHKNSIFFLRTGTVGMSTNGNDATIDLSSGQEGADQIDGKRFVLPRQTYNKSDGLEVEVPADVQQAVDNFTPPEGTILSGSIEQGFIYSW